jgi:hypothetical protein
MANGRILWRKADGFPTIGAVCTRLKNYNENSRRVLNFSSTI